MHSMRMCVSEIINEVSVDFRGRISRCLESTDKRNYCRRPPIRKSPVESVKGVRRRSELDFGRACPLERILSLCLNEDC